MVEKQRDDDWVVDSDMQAKIRKLGSIEQLVRDLIATGDSLNRYVTGHSLLRIAVSKCEVQAIKLLLENGADPDGACPHPTAPPIAAAGACPEAIEMLLDSGCDINTQDHDFQNGYSVLHNAISRIDTASAGDAKSRIRAIETAIARGADMHLRDNSGLTALEYAKKSVKWPELESLFKANLVHAPVSSHSEISDILPVEWTKVSQSQLIESGVTEHIAVDSLNEWVPLKIGRDILLLAKTRDSEAPNLQDYRGEGSNCFLDKRVLSKASKIELASSLRRKLRKDLKRIPEHTPPGIELAQLTLKDFSSSRKCSNRTQALDHQEAGQGIIIRGANIDTKLVLQLFVRGNWQRRFGGIVAEVERLSSAIEAQAKIVAMFHDAILVGLSELIQANEDLLKVIEMRLRLEDNFLIGLEESLAHSPAAVVAETLWEMNSGPVVVFRP